MCATFVTKMVTIIVVHRTRSWPHALTEKYNQVENTFKIHNLNTRFTRLHFVRRFDSLASNNGHTQPDHQSIHKSQSTHSPSKRHRIIITSGELTKPNWRKRIEHSLIVQSMLTWSTCWFYTTTNPISVHKYLRGLNAPA